MKPIFYCTDISSQKLLFCHPTSSLSLIQPKTKSSVNLQTPFQTFALSYQEINQKCLFSLTLHNLHRNGLIKEWLDNDFHNVWVIIKFPIFPLIQILHNICFTNYSHYYPKILLYNKWDQRSKLAKAVQTQQSTSKVKTTMKYQVIILQSLLTFNKYFQISLNTRTHCIHVWLTNLEGHKKSFKILIFPI